MDFEKARIIMQQPGDDRVFRLIRAAATICSPENADKVPIKELLQCLKRGNESGGYYVSDSDGRTWELTSKKVDLSQHVNHVVSVAGHAYVLGGFDGLHPTPDVLETDDGITFHVAATLPVAVRYPAAW